MDVKKELIMCLFELNDVINNECSFKSFKWVFYFD